MSSGIRPADFFFIDELFEMEGGYVLNFSDRTMGQFFAQELNVDIDNPTYAHNGGSKAKRLRCFLTVVDAPMAAQTLRVLWEYRAAYNERRRLEEPVSNAEGRFLQLLAKLEGNPQVAEVALKPLSNSPWALPPHERGYAFERFLNATFKLFGLNPRASFRNRGEQIDGSFELAGNVYLLEAKWEAKPTAAADLHVFEGKLGEKAAWSRGLFVSYSGFTEDGLYAFGRGKRLLCMSGEDFDEMLARELPINEAILRKARRFVETGNPYVRVRDLF